MLTTLHLLHVNPQGRFSVVALVWKHGQGTPIHDHIAWCVVGVHEGQEQETRYIVTEDDPSLVRPVSVQTHGAKDVAWFMPAGTNIHRVENAGDTVAISIHVYGADIAKAGSSPRAVYDDATVVAECR